MRRMMVGLIRTACCRIGWTLDPEVAVSRRPAFTHTRAFYALCVASGIGFLWGFHRLRLRQARAQVRRELEERLIERERIARDLHDTLLQGIQGLILRFQVATDRIPRGESARDLMERALERADQVLEESRNRVKELRTPGRGPGELSEALAETAQPMSAAHLIPYTVTITGTPQPLHPIVREEAFLIATEAIINAFRHSEASRVEIRLTYDVGFFQVSVDDDGCGIDREVLNAGGREEHWGLQGMRERARRIRAQFSIRSDTGRGTEVNLRLPAEVAYQAPVQLRNGWWRALLRFAGWRRSDTGNPDT
jgi:signal transduction histidine kinase